MSENKVPPEFEWIKPGVKVKIKNASGDSKDKFFTVKTKFTVKTNPVFGDFGWTVYLKEFQPLFFNCSELEMAESKPTKITLTLTREEAEALLLQIKKLDGIYRGFIEDELYYRTIEKQIEEKLK